MAFKLKSALKFGQKGTYKQRTYNSPNKQKSPIKQNAVADPNIANPKTKGEHVAPSDKKHQMLKEWLMDKKGFNQEDADRMIADGAYTFKDALKDITGQDGVAVKDGGTLPEVNVSGKVVDGGTLPEVNVSPKDEPAEPKGKGSEGKVSQENFEPAYEGGDHSQEDIDKMTKKEKMQKIDGYDPKLDKKKGSPNKQKVSQEDWEPAYEGGDHSWDDLKKMGEKKIRENFPDEADAILRAIKSRGSSKDIEKKGKAPFKQEGPIPKKNIKLQPGEMEGTYLFGHNYGDEDIPGKGEGFEPTGTRDQRFTAQERIIDLEERAYFLIDNDLESSDEYLGGGDAAKGAKKRKVMENTAKNLLHEADILRKRGDNERKSSSSKMKSPAKQTKSGKGNIFTKKGRNQKVVNRHARLTKKQLESNAKLDEYGTVKELNKFGRISRRKKRTEKKLEKRGIKVKLDK